MRRLLFTLIFSTLCSVGLCQDIIDPMLHNVLNESDSEMIRVNIIFKSQIDIEKLKARGEDIGDKQMRRSVLVDELKLFSEEKQSDVMSILLAEERNNRVIDIKSHWISNAITCTTNRDVIFLLSEHPDIETIGIDGVTQCTVDNEQLTMNNEQLTVNNEQLTIDNEQLTYNVSMVNADKVWDLGYTGKGVIVAIVDSGVNYNHVDLADHLWDGGAQYPNHGYNVIDGNNDPMDNFGHGTHCAGTICGDGTSGLATGMAPDATLMCIKALDDYGYGSTSSFNAGMEFAIEHQADIISMSIGVMNASAADKTLMRNTCVNALQLGVIAAVAAGNDKNMMMVPVPNNVRTPGNCPPPWLHPDQQVNPGDLSCVVSVGAIDENEAPYSEGSMGPVTWTDTQFNDYPYNPNIGLIRPDVCAPGVVIQSLSHSSNDGYSFKSGTSMATPCVAGVMALLLEKQNDLSPADICMTLELTAKKFEETKSNVTGSGLIDAFRAITNLQKGHLTFRGFSINDEDYNNNGNLNAGENVKLSLNFHNDSDVSLSNIKAVISCNNDIVNITDEEAEIDNIAADEEITLLDEFEFSIDDNAECKTPLMFDLNFYDGNDLVSAFSFLIYVSDNKLEFASLIVENDDNNNGILESGETADLGVVLNNIGDELALKVNGTLSCNGPITINNNVSEFNSIGGESSAVAFFNVTVDNNVSDLDVPFELTTTDAFDKEHHFTFNYDNACNYRFELDDYYNDGWDGAALIVKYSDGSPDNILTIEDGGYEEYTLTIKSNVEVTLEWQAGVWDAECSFVVYDEDGEVIYTSPEFPNNRNTFLFSWINDCSCENDYFEMCDAVKDLNGIQGENGIELSWTTDDGQQATEFEIYRGTRFLGTTYETTFTDNSLTESGDYIYSVRMISDECSGLFQNVSVIYNHVSIEENTKANVSVYPNPAKDFIKLSAIGGQSSVVRIYNCIGTIVEEMEIDSEDVEIDISEYNSGIYFININGENGNVIKKFVKN